MKKNNQKKLSSAEISSFCGQVALILEAGIPLYDGMETLAGADSQSEFADIYVEASRKVSATGSLYEALKSDDRWPEYLVEMTGIGERSGQLEQVMRGLESYYAREDRVHSSIVSAITYPVVLGIMLVVIVFILLWRVLPVFDRVLMSMGLSMTGTGNVLLNTGRVIGWVVMVLVALILVALVIGLIMVKTGHRDTVISALQKMMPGMKNMQKKLSASRVAGVLSMMLSSGFPTDEALEMTENVLDNKTASEKVASIRKDLDEGKLFSDAITNTGLFDDLQNRMIIMGCAAGKEDEVLARIASLNEEQLEEDISRMVNIIEPTLVAVLAIIIGAVLLSVMMSMAGILTSL